MPRRRCSQPGLLHVFSDEDVLVRMTRYKNETSQLISKMRKDNRAEKLALQEEISRLEVASPKPSEDDIQEQQDFDWSETRRLFVLKGAQNKLVLLEQRFEVDLLRFRNSPSQTAETMQKENVRNKKMNVETLKQRTSKNRVEVMQVTPKERVERNWEDDDDHYDHGQSDYEGYDEHEYYPDDCQ